VKRECLANEVVSSDQLRGMIGNMFLSVVGTTANQDEVDDIVSNVNLRIAQHGPFKAKGFAQRWLRRAVYSSVNEQGRAKMGLREHLRVDPIVEGADSSGSVRELFDAGESCCPSSSIGLPVVSDDLLALESMLEQAVRYFGRKRTGPNTFVMRDYAASVLEQVRRREPPDLSYKAGVDKAHIMRLRRYLESIAEENGMEEYLK